jgi:YHS domain-containing protein
LIRATLTALMLFAAAASAQKPLLFLPCMMCEILDEDNSPKVLAYFAEYEGKEYAFDTEEHRAAFVKSPDVWLDWHDEPVAEAGTLVPS